MGTATGPSSCSRGGRSEAWGPPRARRPWVWRMHQRHQFNKHPQRRRGRSSSRRCPPPPEGCGKVQSCACRGLQTHLQPQPYLRSRQFPLVMRQGHCSLPPGSRASYQGEPGTGAEATGLLPLAAPSCPATRIAGGSFQQREERRAFYRCVCTLVFITGSRAQGTSLLRPTGLRAPGDLEPLRAAKQGASRYAPNTESAVPQTMGGGELPQGGPNDPEGAGGSPETPLVPERLGHRQAHGLRPRKQGARAGVTVPPNTALSDTEPRSRESPACAGAGPSRPLGGRRK